MEDINKQAELYAESFRYKVDDGSWYEQKKRDFIAGYEAALRIHDVVGRSEQFNCLGGNYAKGIKPCEEWCGEDMCQKPRN